LNKPRDKSASFTLNNHNNLNDKSIKPSLREKFLDKKNERDALNPGSLLSS